jgi:hypothetical protein
MRIVVPVVVDMTDEQVESYASDYGLPLPVRAKDVVSSVRAEVLRAVKDSCAFGQAEARRGASVSIKER